MKKLLVLIVMVAFGSSILLSGSTPAKKPLQPRKLFEEAGIDLVKKTIEQEGIAGFIDALKKKNELPESIYDLPLNTVECVGRDGNKTTVGEVLETLDENDPIESGIMKAYFSSGGEPYLKAKVIRLARKSHQALIEALKKQELPDALYDLPLHTYTIGRSKKKISLGDIIGKLRESDSEEKRVIHSYFSRGGKVYLEELLKTVPNLETLSQFVADYPFVMDHYNPFEINLPDGWCLGFWVEIDALDGDVHARAIKDAYTQRNNLWKTYAEEAERAGNPNMQVIKNYALRIQTYAQMDALVIQGGFARLKEAFVHNELDDSAYDRDLALMSITQNGVQVSIGSLLKEQVVANDSDAITIYRKNRLRGGYSELKELLLKTKKSGDLSEFAQEVGYCPEIAKEVNLFNPGWRLDLLIEESEANGTPEQKGHARTIKAAYNATWAAHKKVFMNVNILRDCLSKVTLSADGIAVLNAYRVKGMHHDDEVVQPYIAEMKSQVLNQIQSALRGVDMQEITALEAWLKGFEQAGIGLDGGSITGYQQKLKKRKEEIVVLAANSGTTDPHETNTQPDKSPSWFTFRKGLLFVAAGLTAAYFYDRDQQNNVEKKATTALANAQSRLLAS